MVLSSRGWVGGDEGNNGHLPIDQARFRAVEQANQAEQEMLAAKAELVRAEAELKQAERRVEATHQEYRIAEQAHAVAVDWAAYTMAPKDATQMTDEEKVRWIPARYLEVARRG